LAVKTRESAMQMPTKESRRTVRSFMIDLDI